MNTKRIRKTVLREEEENGDEEKEMKVGRRKSSLGGGGRRWTVGGRWAYVEGAGLVRPGPFAAKQSSGLLQNMFPAITRF